VHFFLDLNKGLPSYRSLQLRISEQTYGILAMVLVALGLDSVYFLSIAADPSVIQANCSGISTLIICSDCSANIGACDDCSATAHSCGVCSAHFQIFSDCSATAHTCGDYSAIIYYCVDCSATAQISSDYNISDHGFGDTAAIIETFFLIFLFGTYSE
jgi:hypothetical protein